MAPGSADLDVALKFIQEALPKEGVNVLVLEFDYHYQFSKRPEVAETDSLSRDDVKKLVAACRKAGVRLIPQINLLGHQSWQKKTAGLLRAHPEFDETPGKYPDNEGIYCRSYCPSNPAVHEVVFDLIDELAEVCESDAFHVGMDEVFLIGEDDCPRCKGHDKAELFAAEVVILRDHLAKTNRTMWVGRPVVGRRDHRHRQVGGEHEPHVAGDSPGAERHHDLRLALRTRATHGGALRGGGIPGGGLPVAPARRRDCSTRGRALGADPRHRCHRTADAGRYADHVDGNRSLRPGILRRAARERERAGGRHLLSRPVPGIARRRRPVAS